MSLGIEGMSCGHCVSAVSRSLSALAGVTVQSVELGRATVAYDPAAIDPVRIAAAVEAAGYQVIGESK
jgi:copper chaperone CopZ